MLNTALILEKIWVDPTVDPSTFKYEVKVALENDSFGMAKFSASELMNGARSMVFERASAGKMLTAFFSVPDLDSYVATVIHASAFFKKVEEVAQMIESYDSWRNEVTV